MMQQKQVNEAIYQQANPEYGRYEGGQMSSARQRDEAPYEQGSREGSSGKVYPAQRSNTNLFRFSLTLIALGLIVLFALLFVVVIGGSAGGGAFVVACIAIILIAGIGIDKIR